MQNKTESTSILSWNNIYNVGLALGIAGLFAQYIFQKMWLTEVLILGAGALFGVGYLSWLFAVIRRRWHSSFGKVYLTLIHTAIFFIAFIPARWCVSKVMGLPAQDFDITVSLVSALIYPGLWLLAASMAILICGLVMVVLGGICHVSSFPLIDDVFRLVAKVLPDGPVQSFLQNGRRDFAGRMIKHWTGASVVALAMSWAGTWPMQALQAYEQPIKWIAYATDYQQADLYPGIETGSRYRLHENGVVSYASFSNGRVTIRLDQVATPNDGSTNTTR